MKSLAELGSQADQHKRNLQLLRGKERVAEETLANLRAEIEAELSALQSLQDRAQQAFEAIRSPSAHEQETPPEANERNPDGSAYFGGASGVGDTRAFASFANGQSF